MNFLESFFNAFNDLLWATPSAFPFMIVLLLSYGIFITIRLGLIQVRKFAHGVRVVTGYYDDPDDVGDVNHFQALSTALSATVGIGNIAGVAIAIHYGGPGALFWMWITAILGMAIKYSECTLAVHYRKENADGSVSGGPMYYIEQGLGENWKWLSIMFAAAAVICSFLTGNAVQANTVAGTMESAFMIPRYTTGIITAIIVGIVILGGIKRIGSVTSRLAPLMALLYVAGALLILLLNFDQVIPTLGLIVSSAFSPEAGAFGVGSGAFMTTLVWGVKRGLFSNEAGQGSAPIAHAAARTDEPVREGVVALLEPFIDTLLICTMTGLVILITGVWDDKHPSIVDLNSPETSLVITASELSVVNGISHGGSVTRNDFQIDTLFTDFELKTPFNGVISRDDLNSVKIADVNGQDYASLYGRIIENGAPLTAIAFKKGLSPLFPFGEHIVTICVLLFGISTSISWSYYGDRSIQYLLGDGSIIYYKIVYVIAHFIGAIVSLAVIWTIGDITLGLMTIPNIIGLFALSGVVFTLTKKYFDNLEE